LTQREGEGGEYGFAPSDDYQRGGYGREDRNYDRDYNIRDYEPGDRMTGRERGAWRDQPWNRLESGRGGRPGYQESMGYRGRGEDRFIDEDYTERYRRGQRGRAGSDGWRGSSEGPHVGRGPKGYERSSDRIKEDICERLMQHGHIDASEIEIRIENGEVTLTGSVDSRESKRLAETITESVSGVRDVHNQLRLNRTSSDLGEQRMAEQRAGEQRAGEQENGQTGSRGNRRPSQQA
jgi:osmotically-inducible protein OsmY